MLRDFSESSRQKLLGLVSEVENEKLCDFTDWVGDRWLDFEQFIGQLNIKKYINNVNDYHKKVIDKNNATQSSINKIFNDVAKVDNTYYNVFTNIDNLLKQWNKYIVELQSIVNPSNGKFNAAYMGKNLANIIKDIDKYNIECLRDQMVKDVGGELIFNEELIYEYVKKNPAEMTDSEQKLLIDILSQLKDTIATYEVAASYGTDKLGVDIQNSVSWVSNSKKYASYSEVCAHYNDIYVNLLNFIYEKSQDETTFAASIVKASCGELTIDLLGCEYVEKLNSLFDNTSFTSYLLKVKTEKTEHYFIKYENDTNSSLQGSGEFDSAFINDKIKKGGHFDEEKEVTFYDKDGNEISKENSPKFYEDPLTLSEFKKEASESVSIINVNRSVGEKGEVSVVVGQAEAHASIAAGLYVIGSDGDRKFSPGVNAEIGTSVTALEVNWDQQWAGNEMIGLSSKVTATTVKAEAKANIGAQIFGQDGKLDVQLGGKASAELIGGELKGTATANILGGGVGVTGGVNYGIGAHADVGYRDGVFKCDIGASLGVGVSLGFEVDVGGMVDTVADAASAAWDGISDAWDKFTSWW